LHFRPDMAEINLNLVGIGMLIVLIGFIIVFIGALTQSQKDAKVAVGGFVGFIPFGFANDKRMLWALLAVMAVLVFFFVLTYFLRMR